MSISINPKGAAKLVSRYGSAFAMHPDRFAAWSEVVAGLDFNKLSAVATTAKKRGGIMVIPVSGVITPRDDYFGTSMRTVKRQVQEGLDNKGVDTIVLLVDGPGGTAQGMEELAMFLRGARQVKPIVSVVEYLAASAHYWLVASTSGIIAPPSAEVGSVGVWSAHVDMSQALEQEGYRVTLVSAGKYKVEGNPYEPLGDEARGQMQKEVDRFYNAFVLGVVQGRRDTLQNVLGNYGQGRVLSAREAHGVGMIDHVATLDAFLATPAKFPASTSRATRTRNLKAKLDHMAAWTPQKARRVPSR